MQIVKQCVKVNNKVCIFASFTHLGNQKSLPRLFILEMKGKEGIFIFLI